VLDIERPMILSKAHEGIAGGNYTSKETVQNILCAGLWWPTLHKDAKEYCQACDVCEIHPEGMRYIFTHRLRCRHLINGK
jgi:hypothetical protein